jgi:hypothetical protein
MVVAAVNAWLEVRVDWTLIQSRNEDLSGDSDAWIGHIHGHSVTDLSTHSTSGQLHCNKLYELWTTYPSIPKLRADAY